MDSINEYQQLDHNKFKNIFDVLSSNQAALQNLEDKSKG